MFYTYEQLDCALGSEFISEISLNRPELRPDTYLPPPYYWRGFPGEAPEFTAALIFPLLCIVLASGIRPSVLGPSTGRCSFSSPSQRKKDFELGCETRTRLRDIYACTFI